MTAATDTSVARPSSRLAAIDIIRGYCIISMVTAHLAVGSVFSRAIHVFPAFDGASGFILLSGLVLGIVQQRRWERSGLAAVQVKTLRRVGVIYIAQLSIILLSVATALVATKPNENLPPLDTMQPVEVLWSSLALLLVPPAGNVLRLYVVLLLLVLGAYWLLSRGRWLLVIASSLALYGCGYLFPDVLSFHRWGSDALGADWATWQLMFMVALLLGWYWRGLQIADRIRRHSIVVLIVSGLAIAAGYVGEKVAPSLLEKVIFAPGRIVVAFAVVTFLYVLVTWALRIIPRWVFRPVEIIGTRSLDSYVIQAGVAIIVPSFIVYTSYTWEGMAIATATLLMCWAWAEFRRSRYWPPRVIEQQRVAVSSAVSPSSRDA